MTPRQWNFSFPLSSHSILSSLCSRLLPYYVFTPASFISLSPSFISFPPLSSLLFLSWHLAYTNTPALPQPSFRTHVAHRAQQLTIETGPHALLLSPQRHSHRVANRQASRAAVANPHGTRATATEEGQAGAATTATTGYVTVRTCAGYRGLATRCADAPTQSLGMRGVVVNSHG